MNQPLVSIAVITYNSARYVLDTLESIKTQEYERIELVVSDDCSSDDTVSVVSDWIKNNINRFERVEVIQSVVNTGPSGNYNRAEEACCGEWFMTIDGDDILLPNALHKYVEYVENNPDAHIVFAKIKAFGGCVERQKYFENEVFCDSFFYLSPREQLNELVKRNCIPSGTMFCNLERKKKLNIINDERIPMLEDWPKWINYLRKGEIFYYMDKPTIGYRLREDSLSTGEATFSYRQSLALVYIYYVFPTLRNRCSCYSIVKLLYAHHLINDRRWMWVMLWNVYSLYRKVFNKSNLNMFE